MGCAASDPAPGGPRGPADVAESCLPVTFKLQFTQAMFLWKRTEDEKKTLLQKLAKLEEAWLQKEKFIHSNRMILKFREDHISRLEKLLKGGQARLSDPEHEALVDQLQQEVKILKEQVERHPRMSRYAAENYSLREENRQLRALESVRAAAEVNAQLVAELEALLRDRMEAEPAPGAPQSHSTPVPLEGVSTVSVERLKAQLVQKQAELTATVQALEGYKEVTRKQLSELESEKRYLEKSNMRLENILEATKAHKNLEVSQLNKLHVETIKSLTTPTKAYNLRSRLVPLSSPEHMNGEVAVEDIRSEPPPPDMSEVACETLTEELRQVQEQASTFQSQLDEEQARSRKLQHQMGKLEEQVARMAEDLHSKEELLSLERLSWSKEQQGLQESIARLEGELQEEQSRGALLKSEVRDLRVVLQSSDRELGEVKRELERQRVEQEQEVGQLSSALISTRLELDDLRLEREQLLEEGRHLQDTLDTLQAEMKFEADQCRQQLQEKAREAAGQQAQLTAMSDALQAEREHTHTLTVKLHQDKESTFRELGRSVEENAHLHTQVSELATRAQQQAASILNMEQNLVAANTTISTLQEKIDGDKAVVLDLMNQTRELRSKMLQKEQSLTLLTGDLQDVTAKYDGACSEREGLRESVSSMQQELQELREASQRRVASDQIAHELLQEDLTYATEEVERLTRLLGEQEGRLQDTQEEVAQKEATIQQLEEQLKRLKEQKVTEGDAERAGSSPRPSLSPRAHPWTPCTPQSFGTDLTQLLENQTRELEDRRASMMTMEVLLTELNTDRAAKVEEIQRLKAQLNEKEIVHVEIQALLDKFYAMHGQPPHSPNSLGGGVNEEVQQAVLKQLQEERQARDAALAKLSDAEERLQKQEVSLAQSQTCVQELTSELRNRCLELRELYIKEQQQEKLFQEVEILRKQVEVLSEENGKLVGHQNHRQKIEYLVKLKKENTKLIEENELLRSEISLLKEGKKA